MSIRTLTRLLLLGAALILSTPLLWPWSGPVTGLAGIALLGITAAYLALGARPAPVTRWQIRYVLDDRTTGLDRLDGILKFLAARTGRLAIEASSQGLFLEAPPAFDEYIEAQLPLSLPQAVATQSTRSNNNKEAGHLCLSTPTADHLRWATEKPGRLIRLHFHVDSFVTLTSGAATPPGRWLRIPGLRLHRLPVWDELSADTRPSNLLPLTTADAVYCSRSPVLTLIPPASYEPDNGGRYLGKAVDGRPLTLPFSLPFFTVAAPPPFLAQQVAQDLRAGRAAIVISPHRRVLDLIQHDAMSTTVCRWLDQQNSRGSVHLAAVSAGEWSDDASRCEIAIQATENLLADLGLDLTPPAVRSLVGALVRLLAGSAWQTTHDFAIGDLYAVSQNAQILKAFLADLQELAAMEPSTSTCLQQLLRQIGSDTGYVQVVSVLTALRNVLAPLKATSLQALCQPPFTPIGELLTPGSVLLVPMTNADFPEHNRFLASVLGMALNQGIRLAGADLKLTVHLHDPHQYRGDRGYRWINAARKDTRLAAVVDTHDPDNYGQAVLDRVEGQEGELFFRCSQKLAADLAHAWDIVCPLSDLMDLPPGIALARLPGFLAAAKVGS